MRLEGLSRLQIQILLLGEINVLVIEKLREKYMNNPPEGMTSTDIRHMSEEELLDMDYFLNEDIFDDEFAEEDFFLF